MGSDLCGCEVFGFFFFGRLEVTTVFSSGAFWVGSQVTSDPKSGNKGTSLSGSDSVSVSLNMFLMCRILGQI